VPRVWIDLDDGYEYSMMCSKHPEYQALRKPTCEECEVLWVIIESVRRTKHIAREDN